jgi:hypothetical protein
MGLNELEFVAAKFYDYELPPEKKYLLRYFKTDVERQFLRYYLIFGNYHRFTDHTGCACTRRWLRKLREKLEKLDKAHSEARASGDISLIARLESGKEKLS